ncbi:TetR/AcrR family transcriptional regulator [Bacillus massiliigorillae]|uniref:TetR/AcrR family transcriptional regulator n=1 Tax=Bacillus massiliigorillae TaxID=1243664 RepID=UPI0003A9D1B5|nr:TetR/AcrR family transcriptional regulator [Bacillus massiliigorillae]
MESKAKIKRDLILKSATEFVIEHDFNALTLDAVAKHAGISKGGLLYHFPNKEALFLGLAEHIIEDFMQRFNEFAQQDTFEQGKYTRALIDASICDLNENGELNIGLYAASALNPVLAESISNSYQDAQNKIEQDGIDPITATIIRLAMDGLYYSELFNIAPIDDELRKGVIDRLVDMTK